MPPDERLRPRGANQGAQGSAGEHDTDIIVAKADNLADPVGVVETLATVLVEMRPNLPPAVAVSMVVEALDRDACFTLDAAWAEARQAAYPAAIKTAHNRHVGNDFIERRTRQLLDAQPQAGDYPGRWDQSPEWRERFDNAHDRPMCPDACAPRRCCAGGIPGVECRPPVEAS